MNNNKRTIHIGTRMSEEEYSNFMLKNMDAEGRPFLSKSDFIRKSLLTSNINVYNHEIDEYKCFILGKISNNFNQMTKRIHTDHIAENINDDTYQKILVELEKLYDEIVTLTRPLS